MSTLVKSYYAAAAAGDATKACSLLVASFAAGLATSQVQSAPGTRGTCSASMSRLLRQLHQRLVADDIATMMVTSVHVKGKVGLAALGFRTMPEGEILVEREGHVWKIDALLDGEMT